MHTTKAMMDRVQKTVWHHLAQTTQQQVHPTEGLIDPMVFIFD